MLARPVGWPQTKPEETSEDTGAMEPDEPRKKLPDIVLGEDISALSAHELEQRIARLEAEIDRLNGELPELKSFVLPGGTPAAAALHLARTVCRRAERAAVRLVEAGEPVSGPAMQYLNRLSDLVFILARYANRENGDVLWIPGGER